MFVEWQLVGARGTATIVLDRGLAKYERALGEGTAVFHALDDYGVEEFVLFQHDRGQDSVEYRVDVSRAAGLRLVGDTLELLDPGGTPRLRVLAPYIVDSSGERRSARLDVHGCAVDRSPIAPWGRPVTPAGSRACNVFVRWNPTGLRYPLLVDPVWTSTASLAYSRKEHVAVKLQNGKVLVATGEYPVEGLKPGELYDPATGTWAVTGTPVGFRQLSRAVLLDDGRALIVGGDEATSELYNPSTGQFTSTGSMSKKRKRFGLAKLPDSRVLTVGGYAGSPDYELSSAEIYDPSSGSWSATGSMAQARDAVAIAPLPDGRVLATGGKVLGTRFGSTEIYTPGTGKWTGAAGMSTARASHAAVLLPNGLVAAVGGDNTASTELYDPTANTWKTSQPLPVERYGFTATALPDSSVLVTGGSTPNGVSNGTETLTGTTGAVSAAAKMKLERYFHTATVLTSDASSATILVVGGIYSTSINSGTKTAEIRQAKLRAVSCSTADDCFSGACTNGLCCDSPCQGTCMACSTSMKGSGTDGECGTVGAGTDPLNDCEDKGAASCQTNGVCNGSGACALYAAGTQCAADKCVEATASTFACDGSGKCEEKTVDCVPFICDTTTCLESCSSNTDCFFFGHALSPQVCSGGKCVNQQTGGSGGVGAYGGGGSSGYEETGGTASTGSSSSGCGCSTPPRRRDPSALWLLFALTSLAVRRSNAARRS